MTVAQMRRLVENTRDRGWAVVGNAAVPGVLGVGVALCDAGGYPRLAVSVSSLISRMQAPRQRSIADLIRTQLAQDDPGMQRWALPGAQGG
ncbi:Bacterial transcriptional regulator [compost metagenome]